MFKQITQQPARSSSSSRYHEVDTTEVSRRSVGIKRNKGLNDDLRSKFDRQVNLRYAIEKDCPVNVM